MDLQRIIDYATMVVSPKRLEYLVARRFFQLIRSQLYSSPSLGSLINRVSLEGSFAKDTWISGAFDLDVFVSFPRSLGREWVEKKSLSLLLEAVKQYPVKIEYAQHPYVTVVLMGLEANIVPILEVSRPGETRLAVERTPFHTRYVISRLDDELRRDIRLFKSFLKGVGVYGAEVKVGGFSGYLAELIVIYYGGFLEALKNISSWRPPVVVDMEHNQNPESLRAKFKDAPLIWIDPVDPNRNVAAAVRLASLSRLILAAKRFLAKPSTRFFHFDSVPDLPVIPSEDRGVVLVYRNDISGLPEQTVWGELNRIMSRLRGVLLNYGYQVVYTGASSNLVDTSVVVVEVSMEHPKVMVSRGPSTWMKGAERFVEKHLNEKSPIWIGSDGYLYTYRGRYKDLASLVTEKWSEYGSTPHYRGVKPLIYPAGGEPGWLRDLVSEAWRRQPAWLS